MAWPDDVRKTDLRIDFYRGSGAGGQKRNKTSSACRITHLPTGLSACSEEQRSQPQNRAKAFERLAKLLAPRMLEAATKNQPERVRTEDRVRSYHEPRGVVTDHRTNQKYSYTDVIEGDLAQIHRDLLLQAGLE